MEKDIGKIPKNDSTDIVIRIDDFGGKKGLTIREFVTSERYTGFTKAGVRIPAGEFSKFKEMINSISEEDIAETESTEESSESVEAGEAESSKSESSETSESETTEEKSEDKEQENLPDY